MNTLFDLLIFLFLQWRSHMTSALRLKKVNHLGKDASRVAACPSSNLEDDFVVKPIANLGMF